MKRGFAQRSFNHSPAGISSFFASNRTDRFVMISEPAGSSKKSVRTDRVVKAAISLLLLLHAGSFTAQTNSESPMGDQPGKAAQWNLVLNSERTVLEEMTHQSLRAEGGVYAVPGPAGPALQLDGYTGALRSAPLDALAHPLNKTIACWLQLNAYPWNDLPILDQESESQGGSTALFFGLDATGHLLAHARSSDTSGSVVSTDVVPLRTWTLVTLSIDAAGHFAFTIGGQSTSSQAAQQNPTVATSTQETPANDLIVGHVRHPLLPGPSQLIHPQFPVEYSLEGSLGGLTMYQGVLTLANIHALIAAADQKLLEPVPWPKFPAGKPGQHTFGAYYTTLHFDPLWDRTRRIGPDSDVVVTFDDAPTRLVFWQGTNYVPAWVTENNRWYTDEFHGGFQPRMVSGWPRL